MENKVLSGSAPLYGRRTAMIDLTPLNVADARQFFPKYDPETAIIAWSVYGSTPYYFQTIDPDQQLRTNVQESILSERDFLYSEPEFLLRTELRQPNTYFSILRALAHGRRTPNEIAGMAGVKSGSLSTYLQMLRRLRLVERHVPVTESPTPQNAADTESPRRCSDSCTAIRISYACSARTRTTNSLRLDWQIT